MIKHKKHNQGFVILYAVLVAGVISLGGVILANIITKQLILSSIGKESQFAYYAANAGDECARFAYAQGKFGAFLDGTPEGFLGPGEGIQTDLDCAVDQIYSVETIAGGGKKIDFNTKESPISCSEVTVYLSYDPTLNGGTGGEDLTVEARGKNICDQPSHPRLLEKVIYRSGSGGII